MYTLLTVWETSLVAFEYAPPLRLLRGTRPLLLAVSASMAVAPSILLLFLLLLSSPPCKRKRLRLVGRNPGVGSSTRYCYSPVKNRSSRRESSPRGRWVGNPEVGNPGVGGGDPGRESSVAVLSGPSRGREDVGAGAEVEACLSEAGTGATIGSNSSDPDGGRVAWTGDRLAPGRRRRWRGVRAMAFTFRRRCAPAPEGEGSGFGVAAVGGGGGRGMARATAAAAAAAAVGASAVALAIAAGLALTDPAPSSSSSSSSSWSSGSARGVGVGVGGEFCSGGSGGGGLLSSSGEEEEEEGRGGYDSVFGSSSSWNGTASKVGQVGGRGGEG